MFEPISADNIKTENAFASILFALIESYFTALSNVENENWRTPFGETKSKYHTLILPPQYKMCAERNEHETTFFARNTIKRVTNIAVESSFVLAL